MMKDSMRELSEQEISDVSGAGLFNDLSGVVTAVTDGVATVIDSADGFLETIFAGIGSIGVTKK